jgi:predicted O-methyltransferase YrrM
MIEIDYCHIQLITGLAMSHKPNSILEIGIGSGSVTNALLKAVEYNKIGSITCVDNFADWQGKSPDHLQYLFHTSVNMINIDEGDFLRAAKNDAYDFIVSDGDHYNAERYIDDYLRACKSGGILIFHDTSNNDFPNLRHIKNVASNYNHFEFNVSSRPDERCERGCLVLIKD